MPDTVRQAQPVATPGSGKSVDNLHAEFAALPLSDARRDIVFAPLVGNARAGAFTPEPLRAFGRNVRLGAGTYAVGSLPPPRQSAAPIPRVCSALRRASKTTSSENIWLYLCCSSTGFVRCSLDFSAAIVRITVSSCSAAELAIA